MLSTPRAHRQEGRGPAPTQGWRLSPITLPPAMTKRQARPAVRGRRWQHRMKTGVTEPFSSSMVAGRCAGRATKTKSVRLCSRQSMCKRLFSLSTNCPLLQPPAPQDVFQSAYKLRRRENAEVSSRAKYQAAILGSGAAGCAGFAATTATRKRLTYPARFRPTRQPRGLNARAGSLEWWGVVALNGLEVLQFRSPVQPERSVERWWASPGKSLITLARSSCALEGSIASSCTATKFCGWDARGAMLVLAAAVTAEKCLRRDANDVV